MKIKEIGRTVTGKTPSTKVPSNFGGKIPFVTPEDISNVYTVRHTQRNLSESGFASILNNTISGTSVVVACIGNVGDVAICEGRCATNQQLNAITDIKDAINPYYLYYALKTKRKLLNNMAGTTVLKILSKSVFDEIDIEIPPLTRQNKIASILTSIDKKIENNNAINAELEAMAKTIYDYWFLQFEFPDENGKPYKSSGGKMVYNEELKREIPEGWEVSNIGSKDIYTSDYTANGSFAGLAENVKYNDGEPYAILVRIIDLKNDFSKPDDLVYVNKHAYNYLKKSNLRGGEIIICNVGDVGATFMCPNLSMPMTLGPNGIVINSEQYNDYLYLHFASLLGQHSLNSISSGSIQKKFNKTNFRELPLLFPENGVLREFNKIYDPIKLKISNIWHENRELASLRDFLLPLLMNGQVGFKEEV